MTDWIRTSDSLPEPGDMPYTCTPYLISTDFGPDFEDEERYGVWYGIRCKNEEGEVGWYGFMPCGQSPEPGVAPLEYADLDDDEVVAWLPIPDPVTEGQT